MAVIERASRFERRRFITRHDVEDAGASGQPIRLKDRDVVTSEAAQRAADLGVSIERDAAGGSASGYAGTSTPTAPSALVAPAERAVPVADLRRAVRGAILAELGAEPPGLDAVIDRVLRSRSR